MSIPRLRSRSRTGRTERVETVIRALLALIARS
jgi:hypothetical protein